MKEIKFTRIEFHQLVWNESLPSLAKKYDSTYSKLRKLCVEMNIPLPKAGYWENKRLGKVVQIEPLPVDMNSQKEVLLSLLEEGDERKPLMKKVSEIENEIAKISLPVISSKLLKPDPLVIAAQNSLDKKGSEYRFYQGMASTAREEIGIRVSPKNIQRSLRFMDSLIKYFRTKDYDVIFKEGFSHVKICGEEIRFAVKEVTKRVAVKHGTWETSEMIPTGLLSFRMGKSYHEVQWRDGKLTIEEQLPKIIAKLEAHAEKESRERKEREKYWADYHEQRRIELEVQKRKEKDLADFKQLIDDAERWHRSKIVNEYLDIIESSAVFNSSRSADLINWLKWARTHLNRYTRMPNLLLGYDFYSGNETEE